MGRRGFGSPFTHEIWDVSAGEYLMGSANHNVVVMVQIEDRVGLSNVDQIAAVEGIGTSSSALSPAAKERITDIRTPHYRCPFHRAV